MSAPALPADPGPDGSWGRVEIVADGALHPVAVRDVVVDLDHLFAGVDDEVVDQEPSTSS